VKSSASWQQAYVSKFSNQIVSQSDAARFTRPLEGSQFSSESPTSASSTSNFVKNSPPHPFSSAEHLAFLHSIPSGAFNPAQLHTSTPNFQHSSKLEDLPVMSRKARRAVAKILDIRDLEERITATILKKMELCGPLSVAEIGSLLRSHFSFHDFNLIKDKFGGLKAFISLFLFIYSFINS
jgi:hypothetical protein